MIETIINIARYTALDVLHNRFIWLVLICTLASVGLGIFGHSLAITESQEIQTAFMSASLRIFAVFIVCLIVVNSISRELNDKSLDMILSLAIKRSTYYFGKILGYSFIIFFIVLSFGVSLLMTASFTQVLIWSISLFCELLIVASFSFFCSLSMRQVPLAVTIVIGFYLLARSINAAVLMMNAPLLLVDSFANTMMINILMGVSYLIPNLSDFTRSDWLIYENVVWSDLQTIFLQTLSYIILLAGASLIDFYRKNI